MKNLSKLLLPLFLLLLTPANSFAQGKAQRNENNTVFFLNEGGVGNFRADRYGNIGTIAPTDPTSGLSQSVIPVSNAIGLNGVGSIPVGYISTGTDAAEAGSTVTVINAVAHAARVNDVIQFYGGAAGNINVWSPVKAVTANTITVTNAFPTAPQATDGFYVLRPTILQASSPAVGTGASLGVFIDRVNQVTTAGGLLKAEDVASASGDAGVMSLGINNRSRTSFNAVNGDYTPIGVGDMGNVLSSPIFDINITNGAQTIRLEDQPFADQDALTMSGGVLNEALATFSSTSQDIVPVALTRVGSVITAPNFDASTSLVTCAGCTVTQASADQINWGGKCLNLVVDMTSAGTGSVTCTIQGKDTASGKYYTILAGAAVTTITTNLYQVCPALTAVANSVANNFLPKIWRVNCVANNANATTYTVGASIVN